MNITSVFMCILTVLHYYTYTCWKIHIKYSHTLNIPGAGKTYTMLGTQDNPGIYSRALNDLFLLVAKYEEENIYNVSMSYLEVCLCYGDKNL